MSDERADVIVHVSCRKCQAFGPIAVEFNGKGSWLPKECLNCGEEESFVLMAVDRGKPTLRDREGLREVIAGHLGVDIDSLDAIMAAVEERLG